MQLVGEAALKRDLQIVFDVVDLAVMDGVRRGGIDWAVPLVDPST